MISGETLNIDIIKILLVRHNGAVCDILRFNRDSGKFFEIMHRNRFLFAKQPVEHALEGRRACKPHDIEQSADDGGVLLFDKGKKGGEQEAVGAPVIDMFKIGE
jgi:hypothetical protein